MPSNSATLDHLSVSARSPALDAGRAVDAAEPANARQLRPRRIARRLATGAALGLAASIAAVAGCQLDDAPVVSVETAVETGAPADLQPPVELAASCALTVNGPVTDAFQIQLGCDQLYRYVSGDGFLGGIGSFCVYSVDNEKALRAVHARGYLPGYSNPCVTVPQGKVFVFWSVFEGPGCPSGCAPGTAPVPL
jgi:hypothetical protein